MTNSTKKDHPTNALAHLMESRLVAHNLGLIEIPAREQTVILGDPVVIFENDYGDGLEVTEAYRD